MGVRAQRGQGRLRARQECQRVGLWMALETYPAKIDHLALIPGQKRCDRRKTRHGLRARLAAPYFERLMGAAVKEIPNLGNSAAVRIPGISHLQTRATIYCGFATCPQIRRCDVAW